MSLSKYDIEDRAGVEGMDLTSNTAIRLVIVAIIVVICDKCPEVPVLPEARFDCSTSGCFLKFGTIVYRQAYPKDRYRGYVKRYSKNTR